MAKITYQQRQDLEIGNIDFEYRTKAEYTRKQLKNKIEEIKLGTLPHMGFSVEVEGFEEMFNADWNLGGNKKNLAYISTSHLEHIAKQILQKEYNNPILVNPSINYEADIESEPLTGKVKVKGLLIKSKQL